MRPESGIETAAPSATPPTRLTPALGQTERTARAVDGSPARLVHPLLTGWDYASEYFASAAGSRASR
ncbi:hypothetical protein QFZ49_000342 [Streptomyces turgidiscabies]|uniref:Uncharacterized protein n=1 Tax=Streptomyces turgidiscabies TaxID=85558 RepID=A0ABU0RHH1_9ACTN|nr:hypothetical protein [Streptomyces turgidiscabies]